LNDAEPVVDVDRLLETLNRHQVQFLVVGGFSAIAHGATRPTVDFDCLAERSPANLDRLAHALRELTHGYASTDSLTRSPEHSPSWSMPRCS